MSSIKKFENEIEQYTILRRKLVSIMSNLKVAVSEINKCNDEIKNNYQVNDDYTPIVSRNKELKENLKNTYKTLKNNVIPAIDDIVRKTGNKIDELQELDEMED